MWKPPSYWSKVSPQQPASYIIYKDDLGYICAKNGSTGKIDYRDTDAATVIQDAINALTLGRTWKEKVVIKGDFIIKSPLVVGSYTILDFTQAKLKLSSGVNDSLIKIINSSNVDVLVGELDGNRDQQSSGKSHGIYIANSSFVRVMGGKVINCFDSGVYIGENSSDCLVYKVIAENNGDDGIAVGEASNVLIIQCISRNQSPQAGIATGSGFELDDGATNVIIINSIAYGNVIGFEIHKHESLPEVKNAIFIGCIAHDNTEAGFSVESFGGGANQEVTYIGCLSYNNGGYGFYSKLTNKLSIVGCVAFNNGKHGVYIESTNYTNLSNCIIHDNSSSGTYPEVQFELSDNNLIQGNIIYGSKQYGLYVHGSSDNYISDTIIFNNRVSGCQREGIVLLYVENSLISSNYLYNNLRNIDIKYVNKVAVIGNICGYSGAEGIRVENSEGILLGNLVFNTGQSYGGTYNTAITITSNNVSIQQNYVLNCEYGIYENTGSDNNIISSNIFRSVTTPVTKVGANTIVRNNYGYVTENSGVATFSGDGSTTDFEIGAHGLAVTDPEKIVVKVTPISDDAIAASPCVGYVDPADHTKIRVKFASAPASGTDNVKIIWRAEVC